MLKIVECPRDAMQGITHAIPTELKIAYENALLKVGFDTLDFGSFVSPKAIPQMADTAAVLAGLDLDHTDTKLSAIVANKRGADTACTFPEISYLGYPFSLSETFQLRNTRKDMETSFDLVKEVQELCVTHDKQLLLYFSMAFGNPYGDPWHAELVESWTDKMVAEGINLIALADTVGSADEESISSIFTTLLPRFPEVEIGAHFHAHPDDRITKLQAAWDAGCRRFDVALQGYGGCPFAKDDLVGNISTESLLTFANQQQEPLSLDLDALAEAQALAPSIFLHQ
ncbi:MAG: hydroxymethylglutaryl-CoA lyase [Bacteroidota bacterium]